MTNCDHKILMLSGRSNTATRQRDYLSHCVSFMIADSEIVVFTSQSQEILGAPAATCDFLGVFTFSNKQEKKRHNQYNRQKGAQNLENLIVVCDRYPVWVSCVTSVDYRWAGFLLPSLQPAGGQFLTTGGNSSDLCWNQQENKLRALDYL